MILKTFWCLLAHDLRLQGRNHLEWSSLILFFIIVILLLPFTLGPEPELLSRLASSLIWLAVLLMSLLSLDRLFIQDQQDGTLDLVRLSPLPLPVIVLSKLATQSGMMIGTSLFMLLPASFLLGLSPALLPTLSLTLFLGIPALVLLGGVIGALTVTLNKSPALLTILLIPFYIPILIFATGACDTAALGEPPTANLLLLGAVLAALLPTAPFIIAATLRYE